MRKTGHDPAIKPPPRVRREAMVPLPRPRAPVVNSNALLHAVSLSGAELLRSLAPDRSIPYVLAQIGTVGCLDRVQVYENERKSSGRLTPALRYEWSAPDTVAQASQHSGAAPFDRVAPFLAKGETAALLARDADKPLRDFLQSAGIKSALFAPIAADGQWWWGEILIADCDRERRWTIAEIDALKTLADMIGATIGRVRDAGELSDVNRVIENSPAILYRLAVEPPYSLIYVSRNVSRYGYDARELLAAPAHYLDLFHPDDRPELMIDIKRIVDGHVPEAGRERRIRAADGHYIWFEDRTRGVYDEHHRLVAIEGITVDVSERKFAKAELERFSLSDQVTGLANRKAFMQHLARAFQEAKRGQSCFAVHYIDLDRFKDINDVLGHDKGDELLKAVAARLVTSCRTGDLIARFGDDEFVVLQHAVADPSDAGAFALRIIQDLSEPFTLDAELHITASIGIAVFNSEMNDPEELIKHADVALYRAKELGRNQFHFHSEALDTATIERVMLGGDLRRAIERAELELYYQPQIEAQSGRIIGLEALARWHHPKLGLLYPNRFIPIAEKSGTIITLGNWVVDEVCRQIAVWRDKRLVPPIVAINVSAEQLKAVTGFDDEITQRLRAWNLEPSAIELELTESVLMDTTRRDGEIIDKLRLQGLSIAIDDFGTGYSSLAYLRSYRVNHIKIAQEFVRDIQLGSGDVAIVRAAVSLGRELGIAVIAEGVENELQLKLLTEAGCRYFQGFYFSPPVPAWRATELLRQGSLLPGAPAKSEQCA